MPTNLFNAVCSVCKTFKPRCAWVHLRLDDDDKRTTFDDEPIVLCDVCRGLPAYRGQFRYHEKHRAKPKRTA